MEWVIPLQTYQIEHLQLGPITNTAKPLVPLQYKDADLVFPTVAILLPPLPIKSYDVATGRLVLSTVGAPISCTKLQTMQDHLIHAVSSHQSSWFPSALGLKKSGEIRAGFQPMIHDQELHLYCPMTELPAPGIQLYSDGAWKRCTGALAAGTLVPGATVRIAIRILGLSFHIHQGTGQWSGKFRLQHKIIAILCTNTSKTSSEEQKYSPQ